MICMILQKFYGVLFSSRRERERVGYYWTPVRLEWQCLNLRGRIAARSNQGIRALHSPCPPAALELLLPLPSCSPCPPAALALPTA